jgi:hypothetical protein
MRHSITTVSLPPRKVTSFLWPIKDELGLKTAGAYIISKCGKVYMGKLGVSLRPGSRNKTSTSHFIILRNHPWVSASSL